LTAYSKTFSLSTGNTPGIPKQTGQTLVLGVEPNWVEQLQKILDLNSLALSYQTATKNRLAVAAALLAVLLAIALTLPFRLKSDPGNNKETL